MRKKKIENKAKIKIALQHIVIAAYVSFFSCFQHFNSEQLLIESWMVGGWVENAAIFSFVETIDAVLVRSRKFYFSHREKQTIFPPISSV